ncbi:hypothetical protein CRUP_021076 [Coryphaenoides rupestris]|nr:hypothetical protein CRUP_021076 [Coryphaenoides rupestris]
MGTCPNSASPPVTSQLGRYSAQRKIWRAPRLPWGQGHCPMTAYSWPTRSWQTRDPPGCCPRRTSTARSKLSR